jgi:sulfite oxidase
VGQRDDMIVHDKEPIDAFCSRNHGPFPDLDPASWRLRIDGLVDRELVLSLAELQQRFAPRTEVVTLECAGNRRPSPRPHGPVSASRTCWPRPDRCRRRARRLHRAGRLAERGPALRQHRPLPKARSGAVLLAWGMNGAPLPQIHGDPVRMVVPGYIGACSVKWGQRITNQAEPSESYFQAEDYRLLPPDAEPGPAAASPWGR